LVLKRYCLVRVLAYLLDRTQLGDCFRQFCLRCRVVDIGSAILDRLFRCLLASSARASSRSATADRSVGQNGDDAGCTSSMPPET